MRLARGKYCAAGYVDLVDLVRGHDVTWSGSQPNGELTDAMARSVSKAVTVLMQRVEDLFDDGLINGDELDKRLEVLERIVDLDVTYIHTGPGLMGDDYRLHLCAKLRAR